MKPTLRRGSNLVESALVLLVFLMILIGIMDLAQMLFLYHVLADRARAGARYAVVHAFDPAAIRNYVVYNSATPPQNPGAGLWGLTTAMVDASHLDAGTPGDRVEVRIQNYPASFYSPWLPSGFRPGTFRVSMPVESLGAN